MPSLKPSPLAGTDPAHALLDTRLVVLQSLTRIPFYQGEALLPGNKLAGPAVVVRSDTTILLDTPDCAQVDAFGNLVIQVGKQE